MATKILKGKEIDEFIKQNPTVDLKFLDPNEFAKGNKVVIDYHEGDQGFLVNLGKDIVRPFYDTFRGLTGQMTEKEKQNAGRFWLSNLLGVGASLIPIPALGSLAGTAGRVGLGRVIGAGALSGALQSASKADISKPVEVADVLTGAVAGGLTTGALGVGGKVASNLVNKGFRLRELVRPKTTQEIEDILINLAKSNQITPQKNVFGQYVSNVKNPLKNFGMSLSMQGMAIKGGPLSKINSLGDKQFNESVLKNIFKELGGLKRAEDIQAVVSALPQARSRILQYLDDKMGTPYTLSNILDDVVKYASEKGVPASNIKQLSPNQIKEMITRDIIKVMSDNPDVVKFLNPPSAVSLGIKDIEKIANTIKKKKLQNPSLVSPLLDTVEGYFNQFLTNPKGESVPKLINKIAELNTQMGGNKPVLSGSAEEVKQQIGLALQKVLPGQKDLAVKIEKGGDIVITPADAKKWIKRINTISKTSSKKEQKALDLIKKHLEDRIQNVNVILDPKKTPLEFIQFKTQTTTPQPTRLRMKQLSTSEQAELKQVFNELFPNKPELVDALLGINDVKLNNTQLAKIISALEATKNQTKSNREIFETAENFLRQKMNETIKDPALSNINTAYASLYDIVPEVRQGVNNVQEVSQAGQLPSVWGIISKPLFNTAGANIQRLANTLESPISNKTGYALAQAGRIPFSYPESSMLTMQSWDDLSDNPQVLANQITSIYERPKVDKAEAFRQALLVTGNVPQAIQLANFLSEPPRKMSAEERQMITRASYGLAGVNGIKKVLTYGNINNLGLQNALLPGVLNVAQTPEAQLFKLYVDQISEAIGRLMSGGAITANEEARFKRMIPSFGDKPETIYAKINELERMFTNLLPAR